MKLYIRHKDGIPKNLSLDVQVIGEFDPIPEDEFCYILGDEGLRERVNNAFYEGIAPTKGCPQLAEEPNAITSKLPRICKATVEIVMGFFKAVWKKHKSEAIVLLYFSPEEKAYMILVPDQEVDVWKKVKTSHGGSWTTKIDLTYEVPPTPVKLLDRGYKLIGSIHSHGSWAAGHSSTDIADEADRSGLHVTFGNVNHAEPSFSASFVVNGARAEVDVDTVMEAYKEAKEPRKHWIKRVKKGKQQSWSGGWTGGYTNYDSGYVGGYAPASTGKGKGSVYNETELGLVPPLNQDDDEDDADCFGTYEEDAVQCKNCDESADCKDETEYRAIEEEEARAAEAAEDADPATNHNCYGTYEDEDEMCMKCDALSSCKTWTLSVAAAADEIEAKKDEGVA